LVKDNLASKEQADKLESHAKASRAACESASAKMLEAGAYVKSAEAALEQTYLRAPFAGIVAEVTGEVGEFTTPSPPGVATPPAIDLLTNDCHYVIAPIDEVDAANIELQMPVRITMDAFQDKNFPGKVRRVAAYVLDLEKQARTVDVEVTFDDESQIPLIAGYSADVEVVLAVKENVIRIPTEAVNEDGTVLVLNTNELIELREVEVGIKNWRFTEVLSGLDQGEKVILAFGQEDVVPGADAVSESE
jgi:HlyD family secretion protein